MQRKVLLTGAVLGATAVALGAWAAHGLGKIIAEKYVNSFRVGVQYQFLHAFFLLFLSLIPQKHWNKAFNWSFRLVVIGVCLFSFSIYLLAFKEVLDLGFLTKILGPITPIGGVTLIASWLALFKGGLKLKKLHEGL